LLSICFSDDEEVVQAALVHVFVGGLQPFLHDCDGLFPALLPADEIALPGRQEDLRRLFSVQENLRKMRQALVPPKP